VSVVGREDKHDGVKQMTRPAQKSQESGYLYHFRDYLKRDIGEDFPLGELHDHERPDFLVTHSGRILGIEITVLTKRPNVPPVP
jgi:hypothetical protein